MTTVLPVPASGTKSEHLDPAVLAQRVRSGRRGPWAPDQNLGPLVANAVGFVLIFTSWWLMSGMSRPSDQLGWLNVGIAGVVVAGVANALWLARGYRSVVLARALVFPDAPIAATRPASSLPTVNNGEELVAGNAMSRYHRSHCPMVTRKAVKRASRASHERAGRRPCEVCRP